MNHDFLLCEDLHPRLSVQPETKRCQAEELLMSLLPTSKVLLAFLSCPHLPVVVGDRSVEFLTPLRALSVAGRLHRGGSTMSPLERRLTYRLYTVEFLLRSCAPEVVFMPVPHGDPCANVYRYEPPPRQRAFF